MTGNLALLGGEPTTRRTWPRWPRADEGTERILADVLASGRWAISGPFRGRECYERRFAAAFAAFNEVAHCTPTTSGTGALTMALLALGVGRGDEVLVPGLTWVACASSVVNVGAVPILVDIDPRTLAIDASRAREAITDRTVAILIVHPFCALADLDALIALAREHDLPLIEDCAQAHGARWRGGRVGTHGAVGCFSMQQSKVLTCGEGGAVITSDPVLHDRLEQIRCDGRRFSDAPVEGNLELVEVGEVQGRNLCLSEFQAAVLLDRLEHLDDENRHRARRAEELEERLAEVDGVSPLETDDRVTERTYYNFVVRIAPEVFKGNSVDVICQALSAELGTSVNPVYVPLNRHRLLCPWNLPPGDLDEREKTRFDLSRFSLPEAERARRTCLTFVHPALLGDAGTVEEIVRAIKKVQRLAGRLRDLPQQPSTQAF